MKRIAVIFFTLIYLLSTSGVAWSNFYCCGKFKESYWFQFHNSSKDCKGNKKAGCCDTKSFFAKVKDNHSPSSTIKVTGAKINALFYSTFVAVFNFRKASIEPLSFAFLHAPPLISKQPVYLSLNNFRI